MKLIIAIATIYVIYKLIAIAVASAREKARQAQIEAIKREQERAKEYRRRQFEEDVRRVKWMEEIEREQARQAREVERERVRQQKLWEEQRATNEKFDKRISDLETRMSQAEFDIQREIENLNHYTEKLAKLDEDLRHAEWEIESWQKQRHLANATKAEAKADKIRDNIFSIENKVRMAEKRLDKAQRTKDFCEMQMSA